MRQDQRSCVFCGNLGVTKEHVFPQWLRDHLPSDDMTHRVTRQSQDGSLNFEGLGYLKRGKSDTSHLRIVCADCNNGWMSVLQETTRPFLVPLIGGAKGTIFKRGARTLAAWAAMSAMVIDYADLPLVSVSQHDRNYLQSFKLAPKDWRIFIGQMVDTPVGWHGGNRRAFWHRGGKVLEPDEVAQDHRCNAQVTIIRVGALILVASSSDAPIQPARFLRFDRLPGLAQLWPLPLRGVELPRNAFDDEHANLVMATFSGGAL